MPGADREAPRPTASESGRPATGVRHSGSGAIRSRPKVAHSAAEVPRTSAASEAVSVRAAMATWGARPRWTAATNPTRVGAVRALVSTHACRGRVASAGNPNSVRTPGLKAT
jgi:hypothetical protein